jgi:FkbM family methyltransferase
MIRSALKRAIRSLGWEVRRYAPPAAENAQLVAMLSAHDVNLVFDVGANVGQFALALREAGYGGRIVSFEPLKREWERLNELSRHDGLWEIAPRGVIGADDGEVDFHVSNESQCSSVLGMDDAVLKIAPDASYVATERVPMRRLDSVGPHYLRTDSVVFVKADVQGFEDQVIEGAKELLAISVGVYLELSLIPLYREQRLYDELIAELKNSGFALWDFKPEYHDPRSGRMIWGIGVFFRT